MWQLCISINKCACLCLCQNKQVDLPCYKIGNNVLPRVSDMRDLCVKISENLSFFLNTVIILLNKLTPAVF